MPGAELGEGERGGRSQNRRERVKMGMMGPGGAGMKERTVQTVHGQPTGQTSAQSDAGQAKNS